MLEQPNFSAKTDQPWRFIVSEAENRRSRVSRYQEEGPALASTEPSSLLNEPDVTALLGRARNGDAEAFGKLVEEIYDELRVIARSQRRRLGAADTINTTAVVHEAYAKMA